MKLNRIKALCLENERFEIVNGRGCQWIGNGHHFYRVYGARFEIGGLDTLLGVKDSKAAECEWNLYDEGDSEAWRDVPLKDDREVTPVADVWGYDQQLLALDYFGRLIYLRYDALHALEPSARRVYYLRGVGGGLKVACCQGMLVEALLEPVFWDDALTLTRALGRVAAMPTFDPREAAKEVI